MPWALQSLGDKNVSTSRRKLHTDVTRVPELPSSKEQVGRSGTAFSVEKTIVQS